MEMTLNLWQVLLSIATTLVSVCVGAYGFFVLWRREQQASFKQQIETTERLIEVIEKLHNDSSAEHQKLMDYIEKKTGILEKRIDKLELELTEFRREHQAHDVRFQERVKKT